MRADILDMAGRSLPSVFRFLADEENVAVDAALAEALPHLDRAVQPAALELLIERDHLRSQVSLVGGFAESDGPLRTLVAQHVGDLFGAVRATIDSPVFEHRTGAIELIVETRCGPLMYLLADALRHRCQRTRDLAAGGLRGMTAGLLNSFDNEPDAGEIAALSTLAEGLAEALGRAVLTWEIHRRREALEAALWLSDRVGGVIRKKLEEPRTKIAHAICEILDGASDPRLAGFALRGLTMAPLRASAVGAIGRATNATFKRAVVAQSWLLVDVEVERACRRIRDSRWLHQSIDDLLGLGGSEGAAAVRLLGATGGSHDRKIELFRDLERAGSVEIQAAVVWQLVNDDSDAATDLLATLGGRCPGEMERIVAHELDRRVRCPRADAQRPHPELPADASAHLAARRAFERYWEEFERLAPDELGVLTEAMREIAGGVLVAVREKLSSGRARERCRALRVARALGLAEKLEEQIYGLGHDPDPVVRSTGVATLADLPGATSRRILRQALNDRDERVQANAIEALEMLGEEALLADTASKFTSPNARIRANAVKSLLCLELQDAGEALVEMLGDSSRTHRISALWVVERLGLKAVLGRVRQISQDDPDSQVRKRARRVLHRLGFQHDTPADSRQSPVEAGHVSPTLETY
ncbi:MAG: HEAT repeat domain-containing protein [Planctomycetota bacterium]|jgi:hypothetical protein